MKRNKMEKENFTKHYHRKINFKKINKTNFWIELGELAEKYKALNLGLVVNEVLAFFNKI